MRGREASDADLVRRARGGEAAAWRALVRRHTPMVYRLALRTLRQPADAEDAAQEAFVNMSRYLSSFDPTRPLGPWLGRITYHACLRRLGKGGPGDATDPDVLEAVAPDHGASPEAATAARETGDLIVRAVDQLPAQDRFLIGLRYREGHTDVEVAEATGMNVNTVRTRLFRARAALRKLLAPALRPSDEAPPHPAPPARGPARPPALTREATTPDVARAPHPEVSR